MDNAGIRLAGPTTPNLGTEVEDLVGLRRKA